MYFYVLIAVVVGIDQWVKYYIRTHMTIGDSVALWPGVLNLSYFLNKGAAFSIMSGQQWFFVLSTILVIAVVIYYRRKREIQGKPLLEIGVALLVAGAIGNALDRVIFHQVTDFFDLQFVHFAIFNVADVAINIGVVLMALHVIFIGSRSKKDKQIEQ